MKKILSVSIAIFSCIFIVYSVSAESDNLRYVGAKSGLMMREKPDVKGKAISLISIGEEVLLLEEKPEKISIAGKTGKWSKIKWKDKTGWAFGGFLKTQEQERHPGMIYNLLGKRFGFQLNDDERSDEMEIEISSETAFEGSCLLHGSGEAKFTGTFKTEEGDDYDAIILILNGESKGFIVAEKEEKFTRKITDVKFIVRKKADKLYGTISFSPCLGFSDREMSSR